MKKYTFSKILFFVFITCQIAVAESKPFNVTLVSSSSDNNQFWNMTHAFAQASASDLNINLEIKKPKTTLDRFDYLESLKEVFQRERKPDFVIAMLYDKITIDILNLSEINKVPIFIINSNISKNNKKSVGKLRRTFENFIGHIAPNEQKVGYDLAKQLIKIKRETIPDGRLKVSAMAISKNNTKSKQRLLGLQKAVKEEYLAKLYKTVYTSSNKEEAYIQSSRLIRKYYDLNIIWTESEEMTLGASEAIIDKNLQEQTITGGIGFTKESMKSVKNSTVKAIIGGHFMDAGIAVVLINDYLSGADFIEEFESKIDSSMFLITSENVDKYISVFTQNSWQNIDFKKHSKVYNKNLNKYDFSIKKLLN